MIGGGDPLYLKFRVKPTALESSIFSLYSLVAPQL